MCFILLFAGFLCYFLRVVFHCLLLTVIFCCVLSFCCCSLSKDVFIKEVFLEDMNAATGALVRVSYEIFGKPWHRVYMGFYCIFWLLGLSWAQNRFLPIAKPWGTFFISKNSHLLFLARWSDGLKSNYLQLWAEYSIKTPETPYRLSLNGALTAIGHFRCCRWPISWICYPKCEKMSQNDQNSGLRGSNIKISAIVSIIFN